MCYTVVLTGGIGSGKSTIAQMFGKMGIDIIDSDIIARQVLSPGQPALLALHAYFGDEILMRNGVLNRFVLREKICNSDNDREWINNLLHPVIRKIARKKLACSRSPWCLWVVPLLVENSLQSYADRVLLVDVDSVTQVHRTMMRSNMKSEEIEKILSIQASRSQRVAIADDIIDNSGSLDTLKTKVLLLHGYYLFLSSNRDKHVSL
ncbi:dephospho-CoA kinase [Candidatus Erwinia haradaeae]|uniref:Dephospho-CoA kinase n=1 Tax=Candidatus Erwinia haradaeae TaxID=1922217 RepID=A0A803FSW6_9GAMM|nr:dephospho-CoA kinase [Candidatus Erwinia haradaeae]VFP87261.1 Dephospho-CoA kinase [Candidatus Erwinia haradaeae]